ncbi:hypothetical protein F383_06143 [Gossypium arboreum]|uniref:Uncharacterized protein n=1 Tax=Gossypium arboreum TaxID=29729 RepID=A0A0B0PNG0_GOSAR|nr:hypothetical protein F383_06143 [Gossypium arboreum]
MGDAMCTPCRQESYEINWLGHMGGTECSPMCTRKPNYMVGGAMC